MKYAIFTYVREITISHWLNILRGWGITKGRQWDRIAEDGMNSWNKYTWLWDKMKE